MPYLSAVIFAFLLQIALMELEALLTVLLVR